MLFHPGPAKLDCQTCVKFVTNLDRGEIETYTVTNRETDERERIPQPRPAGTLPPCERCPKQSPERAKEIVLSEKNWMAFSHYRQEKAVGVSEAVARDTICRMNFAIIDAIYKDFDRGRDADEFWRRFPGKQ